MNPTHESCVITYSPPESLEARTELFSRLNNYAASDEEKERSLGLFLRGSLLARIFAIADIYRRIVSIPGIILDVGTWRGQTAVICENLRAIYEPLHFNRRIVCFDTFEGYAGFSDKDKATALHRDGTYNVDADGIDYASYLAELLVLHEKCNALGHNNGKHKVIKGDCRTTIPGFFTESPNEFVALAFLDLNNYEPTSAAVEEIWGKLVPGGILAFWQLTRTATPAEGRVYMDSILNLRPHTLCRSDTYPGLCFLIKQ